MNFNVYFIYLLSAFFKNACRKGTYFLGSPPSPLNVCACHSECLCFCQKHRNEGTESFDNFLPFIRGQFKNLTSFNLVDKLYENRGTKYSRISYFISF